MPERRQASSVRLHHACCERRLAVVRQLHDAHPEIAEEFNPFELPFQHFDTLERENDAHLPFALGTLAVGGNSHLEEICGMDLDQLIEVPNLLNSFGKVSSDPAYRRLHYVNAAVA